MSQFNATNLVVDDASSFAPGVADRLGMGGGGGLDPDPDFELEDFLHNGKLFAAPKGLRSALMMQGDYTRKTQELAEARRQFDAERAQHAQAMADQLQARAAAFAIDAQLADYEDVDWEAFEQEDPEQAHAYYQRYLELRAALDEVVEAIREADEIAELEAQRDHHERLNHGHSTLAAEIMDWSPDMARALAEFGQRELGFSADELSGVTDPRLVKLLHRAWQGAAHVQQQARARELGRGQATQPVQAVRGGQTRYAIGADTPDFAAFEKMADLRARG